MSKRVYYPNLLARSINNRFREASPFLFQNTFKVVPFYSPYTYPSFIVSDSVSLIRYLRLLVMAGEDAGIPGTWGVLRSILMSLSD